MGITFIKGFTTLSEDLPAMKEIDKIPERAARMSVIKEWTLEGPYEDDDNNLFIVIRCLDLGVQDFVNISLPDFLFNPDKVEQFISKVVSLATEIELSADVADRFMGKDPNEISPEERKKMAQGRIYDTHRNKMEMVDVPEDDPKSIIIP